MKQKLAVARTLLHHPALIFLDEPTVGIDVQSRAAIWELLRGWLFTVLLVSIVAVAVTEISRLLLGGSVPNVQRTTPLSRLQPEPLTLLKVNPKGCVSVTITLLMVTALLFCTLS